MPGELESLLNTLLKEIPEALMDPNALIIGGGVLIMLYPLAAPVYRAGMGIVTAVAGATVVLSAAGVGYFVTAHWKKKVYIGLLAGTFTACSYGGYQQFVNLTTRPIDLYLEESRQIQQDARACAEQGDLAHQLTCIEQEVREALALTDLYCSCEKKTVIYIDKGGIRSQFYEGEAARICGTMAGRKEVARKCYEHANNLSKGNLPEFSELPPKLKHLQFNRCNNPLLGIKRYFEKK